VNPDQVHDKLRELVYSGRLFAGQPVVESDLAKQLGVGRVPLRDALARLQSEGLIEASPDRGLHVVDFGPAELLEVCSMRVLIEPAAARYAANRAGSGLSIELRRLCVEMSQLDRDANPRMLDLADYQFHLAIVQASGHRRLIHAYEHSHVRILTERVQYAQPSSTPSDDLGARHERIVECIERRQPEAAAEAVREHVAATLKEIEQDLGFRLEDMRSVDE
jgi:DNA-binding GntR family transcriptional regulator